MIPAQINCLEGRRGPNSESFKCQPESQEESELSLSVEPQPEGPLRRDLQEPTEGHLRESVRFGHHHWGLLAGPAKWESPSPVSASPLSHARPLWREQWLGRGRRAREKRPSWSSSPPEEKRFDFLVKVSLSPKAAEAFLLLSPGYKDQAGLLKCSCSEWQGNIFSTPEF